MKNLSLSLGLQLGLALGLLIGAVLAFTTWHEPGCGVLLVYSAARLVIYGGY